MNIVVADSRKHAEAVMGWLKLDPDDWVAHAYGDKLPGVYGFAKLVRPLSGITEEHFDWILEELVPRVALQTFPVPSNWKLDSPEPVHDSERIGLTENALWSY